jgi:hypothetical protein
MIAAVLGVIAASIPEGCRHERVRHRDDLVTRADAVRAERELERRRP